MSDWIVADNLSKKYKKFSALDRISVTIGKGVTLLLGRNGSGKSTFISILEGLTRPSSGFVEINGLSPFKFQSNILNNTTFMPERPTFLGFSKVSEFFHWYSKFNNCSLETVKNYLGILEIAEILNSSVNSLSNGELQLVQLAAALSTENESIVLDEPNSNVDPFRRRLISDAIDKMVKANGSRFLVTSHIVDELFAISNSYIQIDRGHLVNTGQLNGEHNLENMEAHILSREPERIALFLQTIGIHSRRYGKIMAIDLRDLPIAFSSLKPNYLEHFVSIRIMPKFTGYDRLEIV